MKQVVCEKKDYMENDKTKHNSQDEILELLENNTLNNQLIIDSNLQIEDTFKIRNPRTGDISALALFRTDSIFCFKKKIKPTLY